MLCTSPVVMPSEESRREGRLCCHQPVKWIAEHVTSRSSTLGREEKEEQGRRRRRGGASLAFSLDEPLLQILTQGVHLEQFRKQKFHNIALHISYMTRSSNLQIQ